MKIIIKRILVVAIFLIIALFIVNMAPEYELNYKYKEGDIRFIFNNTEITRNLSSLPQTVILVDGEVMLSQDTVDILFDKNLYYEEKYETLITTTKNHRADLKLDSKSLKLDGKIENLKVPPIKVKYDYKEDNRYEESTSSKKNKVEDIIYIPIKALEEVYDMTVEFKDKVIITENNKNRIRVTVNENDTIDLKYAGEEFAKNIETIESGEYLDLFNYNLDKAFVLARSHTGELGFVNNEELKLYNMSPITTETPEETPEKVNIAWDYIGPEARSIGEKANRTKNEGLDVVAPTLLYLKNPKGDLKYNNNVVSSYIKWANNNGYKVWATLKNEYADKHFSLDETSEFLNDMNHRKNAIDELITFAKTNQIAGINVDMEYIYQEDATAFSQFIRELCVEAKKNQIVISVCVNIPDGSPTWSLCYEHKALSEYADYLAVMTYDQYGVSSKTAGPNASLDWVSANIDKLVNREKIDGRKILLGIAFYSRLWKSENSNVKNSVLFMGAAKEYLNKEPKPIWDETAGQYFYENLAGTQKLWIEENESIAKKLELLKEYNLSGVACWMLGYETSDIWHTISENMNY